jgi:hypothetical protein
MSGVSPAELMNILSAENEQLKAEIARLRALEPPEDFAEIEEKYGLTPDVMIERVIEEMRAPPEADARPRRPRQPARRGCCRSRTRGQRNNGSGSKARGPRGDD